MNKEGTSHGTDIWSQQDASARDVPDREIPHTGSRINRWCRAYRAVHLHPVITAWHSLAAGGAPCQHLNLSPGDRDQYSEHGTVPPVGIGEPGEGSRIRG